MTGPRSVPALWRRLPRRVRQALVTLVLVAASTVDALLNFPPPRDWTFTVSIVSAASLLFWRRFPRLVLLVVLPGLYAGTAVLAAMAALYSLARTPRPHWQVYLGAGLVGLGLFVPWPLHQFTVETLSDHTQDLIYAVMLAAGPAALGLLARTREALSERVAELATLRDQERELHAETVLARERARIAREMHDVVSHQAGLIAVQAGALQVTAKDPEVRATAGTLRGLAVATLEELRSMILVLRAAGAGPTELAPQPRLADLPRLVADSDVDAELRLPGPVPPALPEPVERAAYRTVQEALTNVRKHAPGARTEVELRCVWPNGGPPGGESSAGERLVVSVVNGPPTLVRDGTDLSDLPRGGHGLIGLRERATLLGGSFTSGVTSEGGFAVRLSLPIVGPPEEERAG
ncbi:MULTISPECIES: sensor histidine kinase [Streptacidiphilus]|uniref:histidine kinase n=2 Tax=Streptacidiphilus TaxID=228398 RepID=A0ABV6UR67_9ACTN|nr:histidine kinase [Streptacidiphilus jeojiense]